MKQTIEERRSMVRVIVTYFAEGYIFLGSGALVSAISAA